MVSGTWTRIATAALQRSSHSLSVVGARAYLFGGEILPREPVDNAVHVVDLGTGAYEAIAAPGAPIPRVGHAAAVLGSSIYLFSGRGGPALDPLDESGAVHVFDTATASWSTLTPSAGPYPAARSYHCAAAEAGKFIIHAGCGDAATGRLNDVWAFDIGQRTWEKLADAPGAPRGGTTLAALGGLWRFGGFNGTTEVGGAIDLLEKDVWSSRVFGKAEGLARDDGVDLARDAATNGPGPRSVCGMHAVGKRLVVAMGEGKPSITGGHDAAGKFWDDAWAYDPASDKWDEVVTTGEKPAARGWFASDAVDGGIVVQGGLDDNNTRLDDIWVLKLE